MINIDVGRDALFSSLQQVVRFAAKHEVVLPILAGVWIRSEHGQIVVTAGNGSCFLSVPVPDNDVTVHTSGSIVLPAKMLIDIVRTMPEGVITITVDDKLQVAIRSAEHSRYSLTGLDASDYPQHALHETNEIAHLHGHMFKMIIQHAALAAYKKEDSPILKGIHLSFENGMLVSVGCDRVRLSRAEASIPSLTPIRFTIDAAAARELAKTIDDEHMLQFSCARHILVVKETGGKYTFQCGFLEGTYPVNKTMIPDKYATTVTVRTELLLAALERINIIASLEEHAVHMRASAAGLTFSTSGMGNTVTQIVPLSHFEGNSCELTFNVQFALESLKVIQDASVQLHVTANQHLLCLTRNDPVPTFLHLIMAIRTATAYDESRGATT